MSKTTTETVTAPAATEPVGTIQTGEPQHKSWHESLPVDLKENGSLKRYKDVGDLANAYVSLEKTLGGNKIPVPDKHASDADWKNVFQKLGLPESMDKYEVKFEDGSDETFTKEFKSLAFEAGILPKQAQKLVEWYSGKTKGILEQTQTSQVNAVKTAVESLKKEFGAAYDSQVQKAKGALMHYAEGNPEMVKFLDETKVGDTPLASHPAMVKFMVKVSESMKEGQFKGDAFIGSTLTPQQAMVKANQIIGDLNHPYHNKQHANHHHAVKEVADLFNLAN